MLKKTKNIRKILIANRGEIAVRLIRACRDLGLKSVIVFSEADAGAFPTRLADERYLLNGSTATQTYLDSKKIIDAAIETNSDAIHPGYGFLSENSDFAKLVEDSGLILIGPSSDVIFEMGDKLRAREIAKKAKVPVLEAFEYEGQIKEAEKFTKKLGFPVIIKASAGGSGRGIRVCESHEELEAKLEDAAKEAKSAFGNEKVYIEKFLVSPRHIEVQIFGDNHGNFIHVFERECSIQRRRQKLVEEAIAPNLSPVLAKKLREAAISLAKKVNYNSAGTLEFLVDQGESDSGSFFFLEMNTRLQVEHTVSEEVSGIDLAKLQIEIALGKKIEPKMISKDPDKHSIQFRLYAEDPNADFLPSMGTISSCYLPTGPGVRVDTWIEKGTVISPFYDALLAKIIVTGATRDEVLERAKRALYETRIEGVKTNVEFFIWLLGEDDFKNANVHINWLEQKFKKTNQQKSSYFVGALTEE